MKGRKRKEQNKKTSQKKQIRKSASRASRARAKARTASSKRKITTAKNKTAGKKAKKSSTIQEKEREISAGWIVRAVVLITAVAIGLSIYFGIKAKERYDRTSAEQERARLESESQIGLACSGFIPLEKGTYALYYKNSEGIFKVTNFNFNTDSEIVTEDGQPLTQKLLAPGANEFFVKALADDKTEITVLRGESVLNFVYKASFAQATGTFTLKTPSDKSSANETAGIWFDSLSLPTPPEEWRYAAWLLKEDRYYLIGRFIATNQADDNKTYYTGNSPDKVGEDFLTNFAEGAELTDVRSEESVVVITLEPNWHSEGSPFPIALLASAVAPTAQPGTAIPLSLALDALPYCVITSSVNAEKY